VVDRHQSDRPSEARAPLQGSLSHHFVFQRRQTTGHPSRSPDL